MKINLILFLTYFSGTLAQEIVTKDQCQLHSTCPNMSEVLDILKKIDFKKEDEVIRVLSNLDNIAKLSSELNKCLQENSSIMNQKLIENIATNLIENLSGDIKNFHKQVMLATQYGSKSWIREQLKNETTREELESYLFTDNINTIKLLLNVGVNPNIKNSAGKTPLYMAIKKLDLDLVQLLLQNNANPNGKNRSGDLTWIKESKIPPLVLAVRELQGKLIKDINLDNLIIDKYTKLVELLLKFGADVKLKDSNNKTAINIAKDIQIDMAFRRSIEKNYDPKNVKKKKIENLINILVKHGAKK